MDYGPVRIGDTCDHPRCSRKTREGKPYCSEHVLLNPHAAEVIAQIERNKKEAALIEEVMLQVSNNRATSARKLARIMNLPALVVEDAYHKLEKKGRIKLARTQRGSLIAVIEEKNV